LNDLNEYEKRLDLINTEIENVETQVQTLEYSQKVQIPTSMGGARKKYTRKYPKNLIIRN
jgi:hypothetical protein